MMTNKYIVSVVMPVYNVEEYLKEAIDSVISQTIGFRENIQLILVNDGSTDGSGELCRRYKSEYPDNIIYIKKKNGGVSSARNEGMKYVEGTFINFMDSDDAWDKDAFRHLLDYAVEHEKIRIISAKVVFSGRSKGKPYILDYVYSKTRTVNIAKTSKYPLFGVNRTFFHKDCLRGHTYVEGLRLSEDQRFLTEILLQEGHFGVVKDAVYYYRKREDASSAFDGARRDVDYYTITPYEVLVKLLDICREKYGTIIPYMQNLMLVNLRQRIGAVPEGVLTEEEKNSYVETLKSILDIIDDEAIIASVNVPLWQKKVFLCVKHRTDVYGLEGKTIQSLMEKVRMSVKKIDSHDEQLLLEGTAAEKQVSDQALIYAEDDKGERYYPMYKTDPDNNKELVFDGITANTVNYEYELPLRDGTTYSFFLDDGKGTIRQVKQVFSKDSELGNGGNSSFIDGHKVNSTGYGLAIGGE